MRVYSKSLPAARGGKTLLSVTRCYGDGAGDIVVVVEVSVLVPAAGEVAGAVGAPVAGDDVVVV